MEYYRETETKAKVLAYEYSEITSFGVPVHDVQMEENMEGNV